MKYGLLKGIKNEDTLSTVNNLLNTIQEICYLIETLENVEEVDTGDDDGELDEYGVAKYDDHITIHDPHDPFA